MIEIINKKQRDEKRQIAFFTQDGIEFSCGNVPIGLTKAEDIQAHLDSRADEFKLIILRKEYPEADINSISQKEDAKEIEKWNVWIKNGCKNKVIVGYKDEEQTKPIYEHQVIEKQPWQYSHPLWVRLSGEIDKATTLASLKPILKEMIKE